jgi:hypothetical protein
MAVGVKKAGTLRAVALVSAAAMMLISSAGAGAQSSPTPAALSRHLAGADGGGGASEDILNGAAQYAAVRTAPAVTVSSDAFQAAFAQARALPRVGTSWSQLTDRPYQSDNIQYRDPNWSNSGSGNGLVSGRMTAIAVDGATVYAGAADGGVWKSTDRGITWTPIFDQQNVLAIGAIAINPADHSVWVGTGEANTSFDGYSGAGIFRSTNGDTNWHLVGNSLDNSLVSRLTFDGAGYVYASTSQGLLRRSALDLRSDWTTVLKPDPNPTRSPYRTSWMTDIRVKPGTNGQVVLAPLGWRGGTLPTDTQYNGFYQSTTGGAAGSFVKLTPTGDLAGATDIGRTTFSWSKDGGVLYAVVESSATTHLQGVYRSGSGDPTGPWTKIADANKLAASGSANAVPPGAQAWYNQYIQADPADPMHVYLGLEEVYDSSDGGTTWSTIGPYWNFPFPCFNPNPALDTCPMTTHSDQHAIAIAADGFGYFGNDGGMYRRRTSVRTRAGWTDLNLTLHTLQYYAGAAGMMPSGATAVWGGMQDNGTSLLLSNLKTMAQPFGGDGGYVVTDPTNANRAVNEYVYLSMALTTNGGKSNFTVPSYQTISPSCKNPIYQYVNCDPNPRFIAPYLADIHDPLHWVAGGQFVWDNEGKGWATTCSATACDWKNVHDLGALKQTTALGASGPVISAGWCGNGCNPGGALPFISGIDTNYGGKWHRVQSNVLPRRIPTSFAIDPSDPAHVFVTYGAFSRRWIPGGGVGHVFESMDGGTTWVDRSGNLPDAPVNKAILWGGRLAVATDVGVFMTTAATPGSWSQLGSNLPSASANDLQLTPDGQSLLAFTHGRGIWQINKAH